MKIIKRGIDPGDPNVQQKTCSNCSTIIEANIATECTRRTESEDIYTDFDPDGRPPYYYSETVNIEYFETCCPVCSKPIRVLSREISRTHRPDAPKEKWSM